MSVALDLVIVLALVLIAIIDARKLIIPDSLTLIIALAAMIGAGLAGTEQIIESGLGAVMAFALLEGTRRVMSWRLQREAMGFGDVKLMTAGGIWVGAQALPLAILIACGAALIAFGVLSFANRAATQSAAIPFGPYLALGLIATKGLLQFGFV